MQVLLATAVAVAPAVAVAVGHHAVVALAVHDGLGRDAPGELLLPAGRAHDGLRRVRVEEAFRFGGESGFSEKKSLVNQIGGSPFLRTCYTDIAK